MLDIKAIQAILPHRYPMLLVDRIEELEPGRRAVGIKQVSMNEWYFAGHFPGQPIMPGVLQIEACAQVGAIIMLSLPENQGKVPLFAGLDGVRFRRPVVPGDTLRLDVEITKVRGGIGRAHARATVHGEVTAEADALFALADPEKLPG